MINKPTELEEQAGGNWTPANIAKVQTEEAAIKRLEEWFFNFTFPQKPAGKEDWENLRADFSRLLKAQLTQKDQEISILKAEVERLETPIPIDDWHEDMGDVLWWEFPIQEPPYCGTPLDILWPGYYTHFTPLPRPNQPKKKG
jgi:hypothetical protein